MGAGKLLAAALSERIGAPVVPYDQYLREKDSGRVQFQELSENEIFGFSHPREGSAGSDAEPDTMMDPPQFFSFGRTAPVRKRKIKATIGLDSITNFFFTIATIDVFSKQFLCLFLFVK